MSAVTLHPVNMEAGGQYMSQAAEEKKAVATGKGWLSHLALTNVKAATVYVCLFDSTAASGTLLYPAIAVAQNAHVEIPLLYGVQFGTGLYVASSSAVAYSATTTADLFIFAKYRLA